MRSRGADPELVEAERATPEQLAAAPGIAIGSAVHMGGVSAEMRAFFERCAPLWLSGGAAGKLGAAFVCAGLGGRGGGELALLSIHSFLAEQGCVLLPMRRGTPGFAQVGCHWGPIAENTDEHAMAGLTEHGRGFAEALARWERGASEDR